MNLAPYNPATGSRVSSIAPIGGYTMPASSSVSQLVANGANGHPYAAPQSSNAAIGGGPTGGALAAYGASPTLQVPPTPGTGVSLGSPGSTGISGGYSTPTANAQSGAATSGPNSGGSTTGLAILGAGVLAALLFL